MADFSTASVLQAYDGQLFAAPNGTAVPTDRSATLDPTYTSVGWLTEDGLVFNPQLEAGDSIKGWPRGEILLKPAATLEPEFTFSMAQHDSDTLDWIISPDRTMTLVLEYRATRTSANHRLVLPKVKVSEAGEMPFNIDDLISVEITVACERDDSAGYTFCFMIPDETGVDTVTKKY